jgi:tetratricopeptide (TPR) repeat protein
MCARLFMERDCCEHLYKDASALQDFHKGLKIAPNEARLYDGLGSLIYREDHLDQALKYFQRALVLNPKDTYARMYIACIQKKRMQFDGAMEQLEAARSICAQDEWIEIAMGDLLLEKAKNISADDRIRIQGKNRALIHESDPRQREVHTRTENGRLRARKWPVAYQFGTACRPKTCEYALN